MKPLDPVTLAVLNGRLVQIADEMDATLYRSAFNPIIAEAHDACHGLYHAETGATLVQGTSGLPIFVKYASNPAACSAYQSDCASWSFSRPSRAGTSSRQTGQPSANCCKRISLVRVW